jgi:hypothetical protein
MSYEQRLEHIEYTIEMLVLMAGINMALLTIGVSIGIILLIGWLRLSAATFAVLSKTKDLLFQCSNYFNTLKEMTNVTRLSQQRVETATAIAPEIVQEVR